MLSILACIGLLVWLAPLIVMNRRQGLAVIVKLYLICDFNAVNLKSILAGGNACCMLKDSSDVAVCFRFVGFSEFSIGAMLNWHMPSIFRLGTEWRDNQGGGLT